MKTKNYLLAIITLLSVTFSAQEKNNKIEKEAFITIDVEGEERKNLLLLEFLTRDKRVSNSKLSKMIEDQRKMNGGTYENQNLRGNKEFGYGSPSLTTVYYDGEVIFGEGINRLYIIDQVRLKDIKTIKRVRAGTDNEIYVETLEKNK